MPALLLHGLLIFACNCARPTGQFWIAGLSLPPGARVSSRQETPTSQYVAFDYPDDWGPVQAYFTETFEPNGFKVGTADDELAVIRRRHPTWDDAQLEQARADSHQQLSVFSGLDDPQPTIYVKRGSSYMAYLVKIEDTDPGRPAYAMFVTRGERDAEPSAQLK